MTFHQLLTFNIALLVALASPGPGMLIALRTSLTGGLRAGLAVGAGLALMASGWTLSALLGLHGLFQIFPWALTAVRTAGAAYLIYIAWSLWRYADTPLALSGARPQHAFWRGVLVNFTNPKSVLFAAAVLLAIFPAQLSPAQSAVIVLNHLVAEVSFYTVMALALHHAMNAAEGPRFLRLKPWLDRGAGLVMGALGVRLLLVR